MCSSANEAVRKRVPSTWISVQSTKTCARYHTPFVAENYRKLLALKEQLDLDVDQAWMTFLDGFNANQIEYQRAVQVRRREINTADNAGQKNARDRKTRKIKRCAGLKDAQD